MTGKIRWGHRCAALLLAAVTLAAGGCARGGESSLPEASSQPAESTAASTDSTTPSDTTGGETTGSESGDAGTTTRRTDSKTTTRGGGKTTTAKPTTTTEAEKPGANGKIRIGGFCGVDPNFADKQHIREIAEAGFDYVMVEAGFHPMVLKKIGEWCKEYGLQWYFTDDKLYGHNAPFDKSGETVKTYKDYGGFAGNLIRDEPGASQFDALGKGVATYTKQVPGKQAIINLLPMYATNAALEASSYQDYINAYVKKVPTNYISVDIYPCTRMSDGTKTTWEGYAENLDIVATAARKSGREFWGFLQALTWSSGHREPDETDIRWQAYSHLAFGAVNLIYFTYRTPDDNGGEKFTPALIDRSGKKTDTWYAAQKVNKEINALSDVYMQYKSVGAYSHGYHSAVPYLRFDNQYTGAKAIQSIQCDSPLLVGCFEKKSGKGSGYMVVNMSDLQDKETASMKLSIPGAKTVTAHMGGKSVKLTASGGTYALRLGCGEGAFITVE